MAFLRYPGTVFPAAVAILGFACTLRHRSQHGIVLMWRYMRYLSPKFHSTPALPTFKPRSLQLTLTGNPCPSLLNNRLQQLIWQYAQDIASTYPDGQRDRYVDAALTLRVPYWDWAIYPALPDVIAEPQISVNTPSGQQTIDNPLFTYTFQSNAAGNGFPPNDPVHPA